MSGDSKRNSDRNSNSGSNSNSSKNDNNNNRNSKSTRGISKSASVRACMRTRMQGPGAIPSASLLCTENLAKLFVNFAKIKESRKICAKLFLRKNFLRCLW